MSYSSVVAMANSTSLRFRIAAAAAGEGVADPDTWASARMWALVSSPGWADAWDYAIDTQTADNNPDTGARPGVINDQMILAAVQAELNQAQPVALAQASTTAATGTDQPRALTAEEANALPLTEPTPPAPEDSSPREPAPDDDVARPWSPEEDGSTPADQPEGGEQQG